MKKIQQIAVPVDFSKSTKKLVEYAIYMADKLSAVIHFVHVVADYPEDAMIGAPFAQEYQEKAFATSQEKMANLALSSQKTCPGCTGEVVYGDPVDQIIEFAGNKNADLTHYQYSWRQGLGEDSAWQCGRTGFERCSLSCPDH